MIMLAPRAAGRKFLAIDLRESDARAKMDLGRPRDAAPATLRTAGARMRRSCLSFLRMVQLTVKTGAEWMILTAV
jgi:hypothetical protein